MPTDLESLEALQSLTPGELVEVRIVKARNLEFHKKFMALVRLVFENQERFSNITQLLTAVKLEAGWYEDGPVVRGVPSYIPKSISFGKMTAAEFFTFYNEALEAIVRLLPHLNAAGLAEEVMGMLEAWTSRPAASTYTELAVWLAESMGIAKTPTSITYSVGLIGEAMRLLSRSVLGTIVAYGTTGSELSNSPLRYSARAWLMSPSGSAIPLGLTTICSRKPIV